LTGVAQAGGVGEGVSVGTNVAVGKAVDVAEGGMEVWVGTGCVAVISVAVVCGTQEIRRLASKKRIKDLFILFTFSCRIKLEALKFMLI
jgi:hypothetical protein